MKTESQIVFHIKFCFQLKSHKLCYKRSRHCVKSVRIRSYSTTHFPAFWLNTDRYSISLRIQSECGNMRTRITPNMDTFYAVRIFENHGNTDIGLQLVSMNSSPLLKLGVTHEIFIFSGKTLWLTEKFNTCFKTPNFSSETLFKLLKFHHTMDC